MLDSYLFRRDLHYHHEPRELCISVNGEVQSFQKVVSGKGELTLNVDTAESLGFVEVFSEQGLRLLMLNVEPPPAGDGEQSTHVELSNGRTLNADLDFSGPFPALRVTYNDPMASARLENVLETTDALNSKSSPPFKGGVAAAAPLLPEEGWPKAGVVGDDGVVVSVTNTQGSGIPFLDAQTNKTGWFNDLFNATFWLRPGVISAVCVAILIGTIGLWYFNRPPSTEARRALGA